DFLLGDGIIQARIFSLRYGIVTHVRGTNQSQFLGIGDSDSPLADYYLMDGTLVSEQLSLYGSSLGSGIFIQSGGLYNCGGMWLDGYQQTNQHIFGGRYQMIAGHLFCPHINLYGGEFGQ